MSTISILISADLIIAGLNSIVGILLLVIGFIQLRSLNKTNNAQFLQNLTNSFFTSDAIDLMTLFNSDCIEFNINENHPLFLISIEKANKLYTGKKWNEKSYYTAVEIDCYILNHLDEIGILVKYKIIDLESAFQYFGWYINVLMSNDSIRNYFEWIKDYEKNPYVFANLRELHSNFKVRF